MKLTVFRAGLADHSFIFPRESAALARLEAGTTIANGGFRMLVIPTAKCYSPDSTAKFVIGCVGNLTMAVDEDLHLPFATTPPPY